ncbi:ABC transporter permease [Priestia filamentosa]|uniref:Uncharacterized protein n=1 Tax=Priestia filamentosa TaxID=1402861 RepID=A0A0H4KYL6_9BACI|nr:ABC transporter permease [Priestia filamentosa]AKO93408.1 hypothetical protein BEH_15820 [Priestia filamentosa]MDT3763594.1 ABC transporter permease [Priestia filamentosa]WRU94026.1 ABC transporter permease [Priestia filamentosa]SMF15709.1 ABC-2 type transport system permease protein [Priestia filamentosa]
MRIINLMVKEIKSYCRDKQTFLFYLALPIGLMFILGTALSGAFAKDVSINNVNILYKNKGDSEFTESFKSFIKEMEKENDLSFKEAKGKLDGKEAIRKGEYTAYIELHSKEVKIYKNSAASVEQSVVQAIMQNFVDRYNAVYEVTKINPKGIEEAITASNSDYMKERSLNSPDKPNSMDYYAVVMTTMTAFFSLFHSFHLLRGETVLHTSDRLLSSPISKFEIFVGKVLGNLVVNMMFLLAVILFSKYVFKANWGDHLFLIFLLLATEVFLAVSLGICISYIAKTPQTTSVISIVFVQLANFFGGAYFPFTAEEGTFLHLIVNLSPLHWANKGILDVIYAGSFDTALSVLFGNIGIALLCILITTFALQRREGL